MHSAAFEKFPASDGGRACARDRRFFIHVLAFDRPEAIQTLLTSLARSDYNGTGDITLTVHIDAPAEDADEDRKARVSAVRSIASAWDGWTHGPYLVHVRVRNAGVVAPHREGDAGRQPRYRRTVCDAFRLVGLS